MKRKQNLLDLFGGVDDRFVLEAVRSRETAAPAKPKNRFLLIAAVVALTALLVGCGIVYVLSMQDLKLGDQQVTQERWDSEHGTMVEETVIRQVLTFAGLKGTPNYQAAQEWYEFEKTHDPDHQKFYAVKDNPFEYPAKYSFYSPYTQEMQDKIDEISSKYGLKLVGKRVEAQSAADMKEYLGIDRLLLPDAPAKEIDPGVSYRESGYFCYSFHIQMEQADGAWPYQSYVSYTRIPKDCFDHSFLKLDGDDWQERSYTTASGHQVLIMRSPSVWVSWAFCDQGDATIALRLETIWEVYSDDGIDKTPMTDEQLNQILDMIDFGLVPTPGDPAILEGQTVSAGTSQTQNGYTLTLKSAVTDGRTARIILGVTAPEGTVLCKDNSMYGAIFGNFGAGTILQSAGKDFQDYEAKSESMRGLEDGDGKENTVDILYVTEVYMPKEGVSEIYFDPSAEWTLHANGITMERSEYPEGVLTQTVPLFSNEDTWDLTFTFDKDTDTREIEFLTEPMTIKAKVGGVWTEPMDVTMLSFRVSALQLRIKWEDDMPGALGEYDKIVTVVMKDGSRVPLDGSGDYTIPDYMDPIDLDELDYVELIDGTILYPVSTVIPTSNPKQTQNGYTLELKSAVTDGRTARIILGVTAPEGTVLCKKDGIYDMYGAEFGNFGNYSVLQASDGRSWRDYGGGMETMRGLEDGDGKENTVDILYITELMLPNEGMSEIYFDPNLTWTLHIEGITMDRAEYPEKILTQTIPLFSNEDTWDLTFTFDKDTDTREIEFLTEPMTIKAKTGGSGDPLRDVTMESFRVSALQLRLDWKDDIAGDLFDYLSEPYKIVTAVMKDGTRVPFDGEGDYTISDNLDPIDLDELDYVELIDGTKLYPPK